MDILEEMPGSLVELAEEIGLINALALAAIYGGQEFRIPLRFPDSHLVVQIWGREIADRLSARFGGGAIDLAKGESLRRGERDAAIVRDRASMKIADLARHYHLTERRVWGILREHRRGGTGGGEQLKLPL